jgi:hypothetical protein
MEPSLAVAYNSASGDGPLGVGFSLSGLSAITRCPANMAQDQEIRAVQYDAQDRLCLGGARLVEIASGSSTTEYRTFPDSFTKVIAHHGDPKWGPRSFEVFTKGRKMPTGLRQRVREFYEGIALTGLRIRTLRDRGRGAALGRATTS